jgi:hypothetical protein
MTTEQKITNLVAETLAKVGVQPCSTGVLDAMKEAVADIHVILKDCDCRQQKNTGS